MDVLIYMVSFGERPLYNIYPHHNTLRHHPVKYDGHFRRSNKAPAANEHEHASGVFGEDRFVDWSGCSTCVDPKPLRGVGPFCTLEKRLHLHFPG